MPLEGHWERQPVRALPTRERRIVAVVVGALGIAAIAAIVVVIASGSGSTPGCVDLTFASSTGGSSIHLCGRKGADWCHFEATRNDPLAAAARAPCRRAGHG